MDLSKQEAIQQYRERQRESAVGCTTIYKAAIAITGVILALLLWATPDLFGIQSAYQQGAYAT